MNMKAIAKPTSQPAERRALQHDRADLVGDGVKSVTGLDHRRLAVRLACRVRPSVALALTTLLLRFKLGIRVADFAPGTSCAAACSVLPAGRNSAPAPSACAPAVRIVHVAKHDRVSPGRPAGRPSALRRRAIWPVLALGVNPRRVDALHAVGAFFHHAAAAHGDFGIAHHLELRRVSSPGTAGN